MREIAASGATSSTHRRREVPAGPLEPLAAREHRRAGVRAPAERLEDPLERLAADHRLRHERAGRLDQARAEFVVDGVEDDDPARGRAALPGVRERRRERPADGVVEIRVVADDERVLAAELEADLREPPRGDLVDRASGRGGAGEADEVDVRVRDERRPRPRRRARGRR